MTHNIRRGVLCALVVLVVTMLPGCPGDKVATVSGKVTFKNEPLPGGTVIFKNKETGKEARNPIGLDGTYRCDNVPYGVAQVAVEPAPKSIAESLPPGAKDKFGGPKEGSGTENYQKKTEQGTYKDIPQKYRDPATSGLTFTVEKSSDTYEITVPDK